MSELKGCTNSCYDDENNNDKFQKNSRLDKDFTFVAFSISWPIGNIFFSIGHRIINPSG